MAKKCGQCGTKHKGDCPVASLPDPPAAAGDASKKSKKASKKEKFKKEKVASTGKEAKDEAHLVVEATPPALSKSSKKKSKSKTEKETAQAEETEEVSESVETKTDVEVTVTTESIQEEEEVKTTKSKSKKDKKKGRSVKKKDLSSATSASASPDGDGESESASSTEQMEVEPASNTGQVETEPASSTDQMEIEPQKEVELAPPTAQVEAEHALSSREAQAESALETSLGKSASSDDLDFDEVVVGNIYYARVKMNPLVDNSIYNIDESRRRHGYYPCLIVSKIPEHKEATAFGVSTMGGSKKRSLTGYAYIPINGTKADNAWILPISTSGKPGVLGFLNTSYRLILSFGTEGGEPKTTRLDGSTWTKCIAGPAAVQYAFEFERLFMDVIDSPGGWNTDYFRLSAERLADKYRPLLLPSKVAVHHNKDDGLNIDMNCDGDSASDDGSEELNGDSAQDEQKCNPKKRKRGNEEDEYTTGSETRDAARIRQIGPNTTMEQEVLASAITNSNTTATSDGASFNDLYRHFTKEHGVLPCVEISLFHMDDSEVQGLDEIEEEVWDAIWCGERARGYLNLLTA
ncbi:hypothetical protein BJ508DRAFT_344376 [Ascobolus immersus RN42]|uniref:Uncharacterized protein n=1 Tax=Ascobolus immersus RN42 TaxID=1160509 RepID=A0A3N4IE96_ASCIM|nr:hypothetical protein BJ508DRAFT_344376 [Ascobolus immersus RN42]